MLNKKTCATKLQGQEEKHKYLADEPGSFAPAFLPLMLSSRTAGFSTSTS